MSTKVSIKRHIAKSITWRIVGTIDTMLLAWLVSGNPMIGLKVGGLETLTKMILYFFHERAWYHYHFKGIVDHKKEITRKRHLLKTVTWRVIGTIDTIFLAWIVSGNPLIGLKVGAMELFTKMLLYYLHERVWYKFNFGIEKKEN